MRCSAGTDSAWKPALRIGAALLMSAVAWAPANSQESPRTPSASADRKEAQAGVDRAPEHETAAPVEEAAAQRAEAIEQAAKRLQAELETQRARLRTLLEQEKDAKRAARLRARLEVLEQRLSLAADRVALAKALRVTVRKAKEAAAAARAAEQEAKTPEQARQTSIEGLFATRTDLEAALDERSRALRDALRWQEVRRRALEQAKAALEQARSRLHVERDASSPEHETLALTEDAAATAEVRAEIATLDVAIARARLEEARAKLARLDAQLKTLAPERLEAFRKALTERQQRAAKRLEALKQARRAEQRDLIARMREEAAVEEEAARVALEGVRSPEVAALFRLRIENARRKGLLADLEERRREAQAELEREENAFERETIELAKVRTEAEAGRLDHRAIEERLATMRARRDEIRSARLPELAERERAASEAANGYREARERAEAALAAFEADPPPARYLRESKRKELERAVSLTGKLFETSRDTAWAYDQLTELAERRARALEAHLEDPVFDVLYLGNTREQLMRALAYGIGTALLAVIVNVLLRLLLAFTRTTRFTFDEYAVKRLARPIRVAVFLLGGWLVVRTLSMPGGLRHGLLQALRVLVVFDVVYAVYNLVDVIAHALEPVVKKTESKLDDQLLPLMRKVAKVLVVVVGVVEGAKVFGYNLTTVLAGVGVGGIAVALAARDTVANLFGSIMIFTDKPFEVGDWVKLPNVEGVVEEIGLRSTRIRTWEDTVVSIPNSVIGSSAIENVSRFKSRRMYINLGLRYDTPPDRIERAVEIVREVLGERDDIKPDFYVYFNKLEESALNVMVYAFIKFTAWRQYLSARQAVILEILRRFEAEGIRFAFPTRTVELEPQSPPT